MDDGTYCNVLYYYLCFWFSVDEELLLGNDFLDALDLRQYNLYYNFIGLGLLSIALLTLTYIFLLRIKKTT